MFSPSNKIYRDVGRAKDLSAPLYIYIYMKYKEEKCFGLSFYWSAVQVDTNC